MKRRSFLTLLGLSPVVAKAAASGEMIAGEQRDYALKRDAIQGIVTDESAEFGRLWHMPAIQRIQCFGGYITTSGSHATYNTAPRTREGFGG